MMFSDGQSSDTPKATEHQELRECGRVFRDLIGRLIFKCSMCPKAFTFIAEYAMHLDQHPLPSKLLCEKNFQTEIPNQQKDIIKNSPTLIKRTFKLACGVSFSSSEDSDENSVDLLSNVSFSTPNDEPQSTNTAAVFIPEVLSVAKRTILPCSNFDTTHPKPTMKPQPAPMKRATRRIQHEEEPPHIPVPRSMESIRRISYAPCKHCNKRFSSVQRLNAHISQFENTAQPGHHMCTATGCDQKFEAGCLLERHFLNKHSDKKRKFACEICGKRYIYQCTLKQHLDSHTGNKPYKCDVCQKTFPHLAYISIHMRLHTGERPYQCSLCGETFITSSKLSSHMRRRHVGNWKAHQCKICDKKFQYPRQLREHKVTHTGDRPYTCEVCCKSFALPKYIAIHMQTHSGIKPYKCRYCDITFAQLPNRRQHEKLKHERRPEYDDLVLE